LGGLQACSFAFALALVRRCSSLTICIFIRRGNTVTAKEYRHLIQFLEEAGSALSTSMCSAFTLFAFAASCFITLSSIVLYLNVTCTPLVSQIWLFSASLSNSSAKNSSHLSPAVSSACWSYAFHMPCSVDLNQPPSNVLHDLVWQFHEPKKDLWIY